MAYKDKQKRQAAQKRYRAQNKERLLEYDRRRKEKNKELRQAREGLGGAKAKDPLSKLLRGELDLTEKVNAKLGTRPQYKNASFEIRACWCGRAITIYGQGRGGNVKFCDQHGTSGGGLSRTYRRFVGGHCERCSFVPEDQAQLDVHHKDGDHANNALGNLETLCANCHRLIHRRPDPVAPAA